MESGYELGRVNKGVILMDIAIVLFGCRRLRRVTKIEPVYT